MIKPFDALEERDGKTSATRACGIFLSVCLGAGLLMGKVSALYVLLAIAVLFGKATFEQVTRIITGRRSQSTGGSGDQG